MPPQKESNSSKLLPPILALLTDKDRAKFSSAMEVDPNAKSQTYGRSFMCVQSVLLPNQQGVPSPYNRKDLFTVPLRTLCKNLGISNCGSKNKFECRRAIAAYLAYEEQLQKHGLQPSSYHGRQTSSLCWAINVVFSSQFIEAFKTVNDLKKRRDHETTNTNKKFWINAAMAHNYCGGNEKLHMFPAGTVPTPAVVTAAAAAAAAADDDDESTLDGGYAPETDPFSDLVILDETDRHLQELKEDHEINLLAVDQYETATFRKKITNLFHVRRVMKENMTVSGTHDSDPWNFVQAAMNKARKPGLTVLAVYNFYVRCNEHPDLGDHFQPFLDKALLGDTVLLDQDDDDDSMGSSGSSCAGAGRKRSCGGGSSTSASIEDPSPVQKTPSPVEKSVEKSVRKSSKKKKWDKGEEHQKLGVNHVEQIAR